MKYIDKHTKTFLYTKGFTLVELLVSIIISVILLGGVFYFMSETILGISRASANAKFLQDFYGFSSIVKTGSSQVILDFPTQTAPDVLLVTDYIGTSGIIIGVVDQDTGKLTATGSANIYKKNSLGYRSLSSAEILQLRSSPNTAYTYDFFPDKIFQNFYMRNFQIESFNSGAIIDMVLTISPNYLPDFYGTPWSSIAQDELFSYTITF